MGVKLPEFSIVFGMLRTDKPRMIGIVGDYTIFDFFALLKIYNYGSFTKYESLTYQSIWQAQCPES